MCLLNYKYWTFHFVVQKKQKRKKKKNTQKKQRMKKSAEMNRKVYKYVNLERNKALLGQRQACVPGQNLSLARVCYFA